MATVQYHLLFSYFSNDHEVIGGRLICKSHPIHYHSAYWISSLSVMATLKSAVYAPIVMQFLPQWTKVNSLPVISWELLDIFRQWPFHCSVTNAMKSLCHFDTRTPLAGRHYRGPSTPPCKPISVLPICDSKFFHHFLLETNPMFVMCRSGIFPMKGFCATHVIIGIWLINSRLLSSQTVIIILIHHDADNYVDSW